MVTTKIAEKEKKIRRNLRIKEVIDEQGFHLFYPQRKVFGFWTCFYSGSDILDFLFGDACPKHFLYLDNAKGYLDELVNKKIKRKKIIYHDVNYLTH